MKYVSCPGCGYAENWVDDKLKEHYEWENR